MTAPNTTTEIPEVSVAVATLEIGQRAKRPVSTLSVRRAARRIGELHLDTEGRQVLRRSVVETMKRTFAATGYLLPRR